jgi:hypothetical protein
MSLIVVIPFSKAHSYAAICSSLYLDLAESEIVVSVFSVVSHVVASAVSHVVASVVSHVAASAVSHVVASAVSHVVASAVSHVVASAVSHVVASAVSHVATSVTDAVVHELASASLVSSANTKEIVHNKNAPNRRKENFFIFCKIKYKMFLFFEK